MRSLVSAYDLQVPQDLGAALQRLAAEPGVWTPMAGGTDLMVLFEAGQLAARKLLSLWSLGELKGIVVTDAHVTIGALSTFSDVQRHPLLAKEFPSLARAGAETGGLAIQNRGTIGGNVANASPAADTPPVLLVHEAEIELVSVRGARWLAYDGFHVGYKKTVMAPDELIRSIRLKRLGAGARAPRHFYRKVGTRKAQAISKVVLAASLDLDGDIIAGARIAVGSVAPVTMRCKRTEALLAGQRIEPALVQRVRAEIEREVTPIDDIRSTAAFRKHVTGNLLEQVLRELGGSEVR